MSFKIGQKIIPTLHCIINKLKQSTTCKKYIYEIVKRQHFFLSSKLFTYFFEFRNILFIFSIWKKQKMIMKLYEMFSSSLSIVVYSLFKVTKVFQLRKDHLVSILIRRNVVQFLCYYSTAKQAIINDEDKIIYYNKR